MEDVKRRKVMCGKRAWTQQMSWGFLEFLELEA